MISRILTALKQRRVWASIGAIIAFGLPAIGYNAGFDGNVFVDSVMKIIEGVGGLIAIALPIWSYYKPKK